MQHTRLRQGVSASSSRFLSRPNPCRQHPRYVLPYACKGVTAFHSHARRLNIQTKCADHQRGHHVMGRDAQPRDISTSATSDGDMAAALSAAAIQAIAEDDTVAPLKLALAKAQERLQEAITVREALEAEAQEVAQLAVEAAEARDKARAKVQEVVASIEESGRQEQSWRSKVESLQSKLASLQSDDGHLHQIEVLKTELQAAETRLAETERNSAHLQVSMNELYQKAVVAEEAAAKAEDIANAAMKAAEAAVKDELQSTAVVKETLEAFRKSVSQVSNINAASELPAAVMEPAKAAVLEAAGAPTTDTKASTSQPAFVAELSELTPKKPAGLQPAQIALGAFALLALVGWWALDNTAIGQSLQSTVQGWIAFAAEKVGHIHIHEAEKALLEAIWLLLMSIICVPLVVKCVPGGNPVLGYLLGGALVGPHALGLIHDVQSVKHLAELGVVFLLFNIGLELSMDRLASMAKYVFGMGTLQVVLTLLGVAAVTSALVGLSGPAAIILGGALAMSSTAVGIQVLEDRGEMGSRHGRAIFSVLLLQDLAVVVLLMLIPLLAPSPDGSSGGLERIARALGNAALKAAACIFGIIAGGRLVIQPLYKKISGFANAEIFAATTLLVVLGTSFLTSLCGLSLALGAFLAGLLIAETEYALQVESDIAPYKGLLLGLFFMSVGMEISGQLFLAKWKEVLVAIVVLIAGKLAVMAAVGPLFGLSKVSSVRAGLLLAPGGEFAFVAFGEAVARGVLPNSLTNMLYLVVALSMALTPYLAAFGAKLGQLLERSDMTMLQPQEEEMKELRDHVIIAGYGRSGQLISQLLSENLIPFVALDVRSDRVAAGKAQDLPVYFGDAGSPAVLHLLGAERAACAIIALDTPGANYRAVWAMHKHFPNVKVFVRAHTLDHGIRLEKAGATAVVPETLEPSLQLASAVLSEMDFQGDEISNMVDSFRRKHLAELQAISRSEGTSLGYGYNKAKDDKKRQAPSDSDKGQPGQLAGGGSMAIAGAGA